jgi:hypothetical protein
MGPFARPLAAGFLFIEALPLVSKVPFMMDNGVGGGACIIWGRSKDRVWTRRAAAVAEGGTPTT